MTSLNPLRKLYFSLDSKLKPAEVKKLKDLLEPDQLQKNEVEQLNDATDIFIKLEDKGLISLGNLKLLKDLFSTIQRLPLVEEVDGFLRDNRPSRLESQSTDTTSSVQTTDTQDSLHCGITASCERSSAAVHREITRPMQDPKGETTSVQQHIDDHSLHRAQDEHIAQQIQHLQEEQEEVADSTGSPPSKRRKCSSSPIEIQEQTYPGEDVNDTGDTDNLEFSIDEPQWETFERRKYQMELVEPVFEGKNTIICAPTGSGKTITALYIMQRHLTKGFTANTPNRIVFLVNQRPLVEQQGMCLRSTSFQ
ncbi:uncharacterized protein [Ptychodera flava]|uniref:uncharacterized protein n=1 Tax=Ptychodera flava TaxID=63121 RepID=UPI00396A2862